MAFLHLTPFLDFWVLRRNHNVAAQIDHGLKRMESAPWCISVDVREECGDYFHWRVSAPSFAPIEALRDSLRSTCVVRLKPPTKPKPGVEKGRIERWKGDPSNA